MAAIRAPKYQRGLTLIEMLVVLTLMALLATVTALGTGLVGGNATRTEAQAVRVAEDLARVFAHAGQSAQLRGEVLAWFADDTGWQRWGSTVPGTTAHWQPWEDASPQIVIPPELSVDIVQDPQQTTPSETGQQQPAVVFVPAQGAAPFELLIRERSSGRALGRVWLAEDARVRWEAI